MTTTPSAIQPVRGTTSGMLLTALFLVVAILLFIAIYFALPDNQHYGALLLIGVLSLVFALACYFAEALSREPTSQRSLAWGFFGMGFTVLVLTVVLAIAVAFIVWRTRAVRATENQMVSRAAWRNEPAPSAFTYGTANSPSVPK